MLKEKKQIEEKNLVPSCAFLLTNVHQREEASLKEKTGPVRGKNEEARSKLFRGGGGGPISSGGDRFKKVVTWTVRFGEAFPL